MSINRENKLKSDWLLRREAGEGWRDQGLDPHLLKELVYRELAADLLTPDYMSGQDKLRSDEMNAYRHLSRVVLRYKDQHNISDPPPLSPENE